MVLFFSVGASRSDQVHQTPTEMVVAIGSRLPATLSCYHSIETYNQILWYKQQRNNTQLELLGYIVGPSAFPEKGMNLTMGGSADQDQTATLTIQKIDLQSSAVYFCAASLHNAAYYRFTVQKPLI